MVKISHSARAVRRVWRWPVLLLPAFAASAAPVPQPARITQVTLYPGTAEVLRSVRVPAGARELLLGCLPEGFDAASLRLEADAGIRLGPVALTTLPRHQAPECQDGELEARIRALEDRLAALQAEGLGHELVLGHLRAGAAAGDGPPQAPAGRGNGVATLPAAQLAATLATVQRLGQEAAAQQHRLGRERERVELELAPLRAERDRLQGRAGQVRRLAVQLQAGARDGELRLRYLHVGPTWGPAYRAELDTTTSRVRLERLAQVRQSTGEDWRGIALRLSTGSPQSAVQGPPPLPWRWVVETPMVKRALGVELRAMPAPMAAAQVNADAAPPSPEDSPEAPPFEVAAQHGEFGSEFAVPGTVDVASQGQSVGFTLETQSLEARWLVQAVPAVAESAWLLAELDRPAGVWPEGPLQLLREGRSVGQARWPGATAGPGAARDRLTLPFGRDENLRVQRLPIERRDASAGFVGQRAERRVSRAYQVENRHRQPVRLRLLEPLPTAADERIEVASRLDPEPTHPRWQDDAGVAAWEVTLLPGQSQRFGAEYRIGWPKDLPVRER